MFRRVLLPVDPGPATEAAVALALRVLPASGCTVYLVHALGLCPLLGQADRIPLDWDGLYRAQVRAAGALLERYRLRFVRRGFRVEAALLPGAVLPAVTAYARRIRADVAVIGSPPGRRRPPWWPGLAQRLAARMPCAVLLAAPRPPGYVVGLPETADPARS
ncbi:MAG: universal stress protein [Firmicutes bacterium]|nr:universal stress protein [Bacillota bacterium]